MKWTSYLAVAGVAAALAAFPSTASAQDSTAASPHDSIAAHEHSDSSHGAHGHEGRVEGHGRHMRGHEGRMHRGEGQGEGRMHRRMGAGPGRMAGPAERLLAHRAELGLTPEQVGRIEAIRDSFAQRNQPYAEVLRDFRAERRETRGAEPRQERRTRTERPELPAEVRAAMDSIRTNREAARREAMSVLTDAQRAQIADKMERRTERRSRLNQQQQGT